jgi:hypothetical protein
MKAKQLLILCVVLAVAAGIGFYLRNQRRAAWQPSGTASGQKVLGEFDPNAVLSVTLDAGGGAKVTAVKSESRWVVKEREDFPADFDKVGSLVRQLWELKAVQQVPATEAQFPRLGLVPPGEKAADGSGVSIALAGKDDKPVARLLLGKTHYRGGDGDGEGGGGIAAGRYVLATGGEKTMPVLVSETFSNVEAKPEQWISKEFVKAEGITSVEVAGTEEGVRWKLSRPAGNGTWELDGAAGEEKLDSTKIPSIDSLLGSPRFTDVAVGPDAAKGLETPSRIDVATGDGFRYGFEVGALDGDRYPVRISVSAGLAENREAKPDEKPEEKEKLDKEFADRKAELAAKLEREKKFEGRVFFVPQYSLKPLLVKRSDLLAPPPTPTPTPSPDPAASQPVSVATEPVSVPATVEDAAKPEPAKPKAKKNR